MIDRGDKTYEQKIEAVVLDEDIYIICRVHREPIGIFELKNPPSNPKCDCCEEHREQHH